MRAMGGRGGGSDWPVQIPPVNGKAAECSKFEAPEFRREIYNNIFWMAARANLTVSAKLRDEFTKAQNGKVRLLKVQINDAKESIDFISSVPPTSNVEADFNAIPRSLVRNEACYILFCLNVSAVGKLKWLLLAWVPENCYVRHKMLYASSREDLRVQIGKGFFEGEFYANEVNEVTYELFKESRNRDHGEAPLTENEIIQREEAKMERDTSTKSTAMGVVPFSMAAPLKKSLEAFQKSGDNFVEMSVDPSSERINLVAATRIDMSRGKIASRMNSAEPRFLAVRYPRTLDGGVGESKLFVFVCPEDANVRLKMMYSTCKATFMAIAADMGLKFDKMIETRGADEVDEALKTATMSAQEAAAINAANTPAPFSKPMRPGRGRARMTAGRGRG